MSEPYIPFGGGKQSPTGGELGAIDATPAFLGGSGSGGSDAGSGGQFDPAIHAGPDKRNADGSYRRKRGRKSGSAGNRNAKAELSVGIETLANMLGIVHLGIASLANTPELKLKDDEAEALAKATAEVLAEFDIRPDPKITAIVGLITTAGVIYTPKVYFIRQRWQEEAKAKAADEASQAAPVYASS